MSISYRKAVPDHGVDALGVELRALIGNLSTNLNGKINDLNVRVAELEQTGTITISSIVINNTNRTATVSVIASDHTPGTTVGVNITDTTNNSEAKDATLVVNPEGDRQVATVTLPISALAAGSLTIVISSQDMFGKAHTDTAVRPYSPVATSITVTNLELDPRRRLVSLGVTLDIGYPGSTLLAKSQAKLTVTDANNPSTVILSARVPTGQAGSTNKLLWTGIELPTTATSMNFKITAVDAYGDAATGSRNGVAAEGFDKAGVVANEATVNNTTYMATIKAIVWSPKTATLKLSNSGGTINLNDATARKTNTIEGPKVPGVSYTGAKSYIWTVDVKSLGAEPIDVEVGLTDTHGRTDSSVTVISYAPLGTVNVTANNVNSAAKTLTTKMTTKYVSVGQTATMTLSSAINGYSETVTAKVVNGTTSFPVTNLSAFPYGRINQSITVVDQVGKIASWDGNATFSDVQGDIQLNTGTTKVDSVAETATVKWSITGVVTVDRVSVTDVNGKRIEQTNVSTVESGGVFTEVLDVSTLAYGNVTIKVEGRDGGNRALSDNIAKAFLNKDGTITVSGITANPNTRTFSLTGSFKNLAASSLIQVVHYPAGSSGSATTANLLTASGDGTISRSFAYSYPDKTDISYYLKGTDVKGASVQTPLAAAYTGEVGTLTLDASVNSVTGIMSISGLANTSINSGTTVTISITGPSTLSSTTTVISNLTYSKSVQLPSGKHGNYTVKVSATDRYGATATTTKTGVAYQSVNGAIAITGVGSNGEASTLTVTGTKSNIPAGRTITLRVTEKGSSSVRETVTYVTPNTSGIWSKVINISGPVHARSVPYGNVTVTAEVTDSGGTVRRGSRDGVYSAPAGSLDLSIVSKDIINGYLRIRYSWTNLIEATSMNMVAKVDGKPLYYNPKANTSTGSGEFTFNIINPGSNPDIDITARSLDYNNSTVKDEINNIPWDNSSVITITSLSIPTGTDNLTFAGKMTKVGKGHKVVLKGQLTSGGATVSAIVYTTAADTGNGAPFSASVGLKSLGNGTVRGTATSGDKGGVTRSSSSTTVWSGNGTITPSAGYMVYNSNPSSGATVVGKATISGIWSSGQSTFTAKTYAYDNKADTSRSLVHTQTVSPSGNTVQSSYAVSNGGSNHGRQFEVEFSRRDAAGNVITATNKNERETLTFSAPARFYDLPKYKGPSANGGSTYTYTILCYLEYGKYRWLSPLTRHSRPGNGTLISVAERLVRWNGFAAYFEFDIDDRSLVGNYPIEVTWLTSRTTAAKEDLIRATATHVKEEDASLFLSAFGLRVTWRRDNPYMTGMYARGNLTASSPSGRTVYCRFWADWGSKPETTYTATTDANGSWSIETSGMDGVIAPSDEVIRARANCVYSGKTITSNQRSVVVPRPRGQDPK